MQREAIQESSDSAIAKSNPNKKPQSSGLISLAALSACGGGGGGSGGQQKTTSAANDGTNQTANPSPLDQSGFIVDNSSSSNGANAGVSGGTNTHNPTDEKTPPTEQEAARFLMQASFGGTYEQIQTVQTKGFETWLDDELNSP